MSKKSKVRNWLRQAQDGTIFTIYSLADEVLVTRSAVSNVIQSDLSGLGCFEKIKIGNTRRIKFKIIANRLRFVLGVG